MIIHKLFLSIFSFIITTSIYGQHFDWVKSFKGNWNNDGNSIIVDSSGNIYTTGSFLSTVDFDPGAGVSNHTSSSYLGSLTAEDIFVHKMDSSGNLIWCKTFGGSTGDTGESITIDNSGYIYTAGMFSGSVDFDPGPGTSFHTSTGNHDVFVHKMDSSGNFIWCKTFGGTLQENVKEIIIDNSNNIYIAGYFGDTVDFDPGTNTHLLSAVGSDELFVQKMDSSGNFIWAKSFGADLHGEWVSSLALDSSSNVYTTGYFRGTGDFDPGTGIFNLTSAGFGFDSFIHKMDSSGNFIWVKSFGKINNHTTSSHIAVDAPGNIYCIGKFLDTVDFDPGIGIYNLTSNPNRAAVFILKLNSSGNFVWAKSIKNASVNYSVPSIVIGNDGSLYSGGFFGDTVDLDPGIGISNHISIGDDDIYIQNIDTSGNFIWAKSFGGLGEDRPKFITLDALGNIYTIGTYSNTVDFDFGIGNAVISATNSSRDIFIHKISKCSPNETIHVSNQSICDTSFSILSILNNYDSYLWSNGSTTSSITINDTNTYSAYLSMNNGCGTLTNSVKINIFDCSNFIDTNIVSATDTCLLDTNATIMNSYINNIFTLSDSVYVTWNFILNTGDTIFIDAGYLFSQNGVYSIGISIDCNGLKSNGDIFYDLIEITHLSTSLMKESYTNKYKIYPNPTKDYIKISSPYKAEHTTINILSSRGKLIKSISTNNSDSITLNIKDLKRALYFIEIISNHNERYFYKVVKN